MSGQPKEKQKAKAGKPKKPADEKKHPAKKAKGSPRSESKKVLAGTNPMGRPTKFTEAVKKKILIALRGGNYIEVAAAHAGVTKETIYDWLRQGACQEAGAFKDFSDAVSEAMARAEINSLKRIEKAGTKDWKAEAWRLERRHSGRWGRPNPVGSSVTVETGEGEKKTKVTISDLYKELQEVE